MVTKKKEINCYVLHFLPILSSAGLKSVIVLVPLPHLNLSAPGPPVSSLVPLPPLILSFPSPPIGNAGIWLVYMIYFYRR